MNDAAEPARPPIRHAYVVDDDEPFRRSLRVLLEAAGWSTKDFASGAEFAEKAGELEPGILLLDLNLAEGSGLDLIERSGQALDRFAVVMMTGAGEIATAVRSIKAGAADFLEKPFFSEELLGRLNAIAKDFAARLQAKSAVWEAQRRAAMLSPRERDVLERLLCGASNKLIARDLEISPRTVEMHRARMVAKLGVATTAEALELGRLAGVRSDRELAGGGRTGGTAQ
jgi:two-component system response regulator FixJ